MRKLKPVPTREPLRVRPIFKHLALMALFAGARIAGAAVFTVNDTDDTADAFPGDGVAADARGLTTLRAAIMEANALAGADEIRLGAFTYALALDIEGDLDIKSEVSITGMGRDVTVIDGGGHTAFRVELGAILSLKGMTITNAFQPVDEAHADVQRAGVHNFGTAMIEECRFTDNNMGVWNEGGDAQITDSEFDHNGSLMGGSAICNMNGYASVSNIYCANNYAAESLYPGLALPAGCILSRGDDAHFMMSSSRLDGHSIIVAPWQNASVILQDGGDMICTNVLCSFQAKEEICVIKGRLRLEGHRQQGGYIVSLQALQDDGAIERPIMEIVDSDLSLYDDLYAINAIVYIINSALYGSLYMVNALAQVSYCTLYYSGSVGTGATVYIDESSHCEVSNSIITSYNPLVIPSISGAIMSQGWNVIARTVPGQMFHPTDLLDVDPLVHVTGVASRLEMNLLPGSPAIDAADPLSDFPQVDHLGVHRPRDGDGDGVALPDIGASEYLPEAAGREAADFDGSGCTDIADFLVLMDNWEGEFEGEPILLQDFLNLLDYWLTGPNCG